MPSWLEDFGDSYAIERELGHGATATVYLARDVENGGRRVAIKVLSPDFAFAVPRERFRREIETTARLNHPHIVTLFRSGRLRDDRPYFVMKYIEGETLHERIVRQRRLPVPEALTIARQVANALAYAHRNDVIHRDVKPTNIMLEGDHAWVTDFGIARQYSGGGTTVTTTGTGIGTPAYMSPEQVVGDPNLDPRTDVYSLGCVLYEMLTGRLPFDSPDMQTMLAQQLTAMPAPLRSLRPEVSSTLEFVLARALAKHRDDRFQTAQELADALSFEGAAPLTPTRTEPAAPASRRRAPRARALLWVASVVVIAGAAAAVRGLRHGAFNADWYLVTSAWEYGQGTTASMNAGRLLQDALNQWQGITVLGPADAAPSRGARAAWRISGNVSRVGDSVRVRAQLYGARGDSLVRERVVNLSPALMGVDAGFARLADQLLFDDSVPAATGGGAGTRVVAARRAFARGLDAVQGWDLAAADSSFRQATDADGGFAQAHLWLALTRFWASSPVMTWRSALERAATGLRRVSARDSLVFAALTAAADASGRSCDAWEALTRRYAHDFAGWYSLASCLSHDDVVLRDARSPSGWRFRSSYQRAIRAYQTAFALSPAIHRALSANSYAAVRRLLKTGAGATRTGHAAPPDSGGFAARPAWLHDTLAFIPYRQRQFADAPTPAGNNARLAAQRQREIFHDIATAWVTAYPQSADALEALAVSLELLQDRRAVDAIRRARELSRDPGQRIRLAGAQVWMLVKFSLPSDTAGLGAARVLADSLLATPIGSDPDAIRTLLSLAMLTGRATLAAELARSPAFSSDEQVPPALFPSALPLLVFAALGGPLDSVRVLEAQTTGVIAREMLAADQQDATMRFLVRPARLAFPEYRFPALPQLAVGGDYLVRAQLAWSRGDTAAVLRTFDELRRVRRLLSPATVAAEGIYAEARLLFACGDVRGAAAWLDAYLDAVTAVAPESFLDFSNAGALTRALALRAELAGQMHDQTSARRYAAAVEILWRRADAFLDPRLSRMRRLAAAGGV